MTMIEAAKEVLSTASEPMHVRHVQAAIVERKLFTFGAKNPVSVLGSEMSKHCEGSKALKDRAPTFRRVGPGTYALVG